MNRKMMIGASYDSYSNTNGIQYKYHLFWGLKFSMWSSGGWMSCMRCIDTWGGTLDPSYMLSVGHHSKCWRRKKINTQSHRFSGRWRSNRIPLDVILYWGTEFQCWWVYNVSGKPQRNYIREIWAWVYLPSQKTHSGADRILIEGVTLEHWPMVNMLGDHFTKPLQGSLLRNSHEETQAIPDDIFELYMLWG